MRKAASEEKPGRRQRWPRARIEAGIKRAFKSVLVIGEDDGHTIYDVEDAGLRFVVALVHVDGPKGGVVEIGFLARFVGFRLSEPVLRRLNGELHLSSAFVEEGDLYVLAKIAAKGRFEDSRFALVLSAWKRDVAFALKALGEAPSRAAGEPAGGLERTGEFAFDARQIKARPRAFHAALFWRGEPLVVCRACAGRGVRGLFKRECAVCDGSGFRDPTR
jgi:hypothetical protein